jgi:hypothetical protein
MNITLQIRTGLLSALLLIGAAGTRAAERTILAGHENGTPADAPSLRIDPLGAASPFNFVGAMHINSGASSFIRIWTSDRSGQEPMPVIVISRPELRGAAKQDPTHHRNVPPEPLRFPSLASRKQKHVMDPICGCRRTFGRYDTPAHVLVICQLRLDRLIAITAQFSSTALGSQP